MASDGSLWPFRVLCDMGSQISCITNSAVQFLKLPREHYNATISGVGNSSTVQTRGKVQISLHSRINEFSVPVHALILPAVTAPLPSQTLDPRKWPRFNELALADPTYFKTGDIDLLIGADVCGNITSNGFIQGNVNTPHAMKTKLGWILFGPIATHRSNTYQPETMFTHSTLMETNTLEQTLRHFWELEEGIYNQMNKSNSAFSSQEIECSEFFARTHSRTPEGRYVVRIPFSRDPSELGNSRTIALNQFYRLEHRLKRNPELRRLYVDFMETYRDMNHMRVATQPSEPGRVYYIPHHAVTEKFRVVFNASARTSNDLSLNDIQMNGPIVQAPLFHIMLRFRKFRIALVADVEKMFRQILISEEDLDLQRIFWRSSPKDPLEEYQLLTVTYGMKSAPFNSTKSLDQCAIDHQNEFPEASARVSKSFYVDDYMDGADSEEDAIKLKESVDQLLRKGGFILRKWASNSWLVHSSIQDRDSDINYEVEISEKSIVSVLGLTWQPFTDVLTYKVQEYFSTQVITKRVMLSEISKLFDPIGLLGPVIIIGKLLIKQLWILGIAWDDEVPNEVLGNWLTLRNQLIQLNQLSIPRWIGMSHHHPVEVHAFCDASCLAFAAAIYIRTTSEAGEVSCHLLTSKTRVAPIRTASIPRLELCGAHLAVKLFNEIKEPLSLQEVPVVFWTDSTIVLYWLRKLPCQLKTYAANRVSEIQAHSTPTSWRHVPTKSNPADCASRGLLPSELLTHRQWWYGPEFLLRPENDWPQNQLFTSKPDLEAAQSEEKVVICIHTAEIKSRQPMTINQCTLPHRYSRLQKLLRVTVYVKRAFMHNRGRARAVPISADELNEALLYWIRYEQCQEFAEEIELCDRNLALDKESKLFSMAPTLEDNILRVGGRLENANIAYSAKHPIILPKNSRLAQLIVDETHRTTLHGGLRLVMGQVNQQYWIIGLRNLVKANNNRCVVCYRQRHKLMEQQMASLPAARVRPGHPFEKCSVDYCGPITLKVGLKRSKVTMKGYIAVFVCVVTKAVHLELVSDLTTAAFMASLSRFIGRRGLPIEIWSDNGTNFVGANNEILRQVDQIHVYQYCASQGIRWKFIPPGAPHQGGLWESAVKSAKFHLVRVIGKQTLNFEEMSTVLIRIEACLNSRPLMPLYDDPEGNLVLTPGHFLIGRPLLARLEPDVMNTPSNRLDNWKLLQKIMQDFWHTWSREYLVTLQQRNKWQITRTNAEVNDIVIVKHENLPPTYWPIGRVIQIHPGSDGNVRVVTIKLPNGEIKRPIQKLAVLPIKPEQKI